MPIGLGVNRNRYKREEQPYPEKQDAEQDAGTGVPSLISFVFYHQDELPVPVSPCRQDELPVPVSLGTQFARRFAKGEDSHVIFTN